MTFIYTKKCCCFFCFRPCPQQNQPKYLIEDYPKAFIDYLHNGNINSRAMFSSSFVDHMRIPRAMEVKIIDTVNSLNESHSQPPYSPTNHTPTRSMNELLNPDMFSFPDERITPALPERERMPPSRQQSFRYSNMSVEESKERIYKEKMLVSELREKLRNQKKVDERNWNVRTPHSDKLQSNEFT